MNNEQPTLRVSGREDKHTYSARSGQFNRLAMDCRMALKNDVAIASLVGDGQARLFSILKVKGRSNRTV